MKIKSLILGLGLMSSAAMAETYNAQVSFEHFDENGFDLNQLTGNYYFEQVETNNTAWAEAAFMGRNNNVSVGYTDFDSRANGISFAGEFFGQNGNDIYAAIEATYIDPDNGSSDTVLRGTLGYFFATNWLVSVSAIDSDVEDSVSLNTKYVAVLGNDRFFNVEATYNDESEDVYAYGDYYWSAQSSLGLILSDTEGFDYGLRFQHFFNSQVAAKITFISTDYDDTTGIALTARF